MIDLLCECGHESELHVILPGDPDSAIECYGSDDCDCSQYIVRDPSEEDQEP